MNKFRQIRSPQPPPRQRLEEVVIGFEGFRSDQPTHMLPLKSAAQLDHMRMERGALRKDFGWDAIGNAAASRILGIFEHKFIYGDEVFSRVVRIFKEGGYARLQVWDGNAWVDAALSSDPIETDVNLSMVSTLGNLAIADGKRILRWAEDRLLIPQEDDFPSGAAGELTAEGTEIDATVVPAGSADNTYSIHYSVDFAGATDITAVVKFFHNGTLLGQRTYEAIAADLPKSFAHEIFTFSGELVNGDTVTIRIESISAGAASRTTIQDVFSGGGGIPDFAATKSVATEAWNDRYEYFYTVDASARDVTVEIWINPNGSGWILHDSIPYQQGESGNYSYPMVKDGLGGGTEFGLSDPTGSITEIMAEEVVWEHETVTASTVTVEGFNKATDADAAAGVTYDILGEVVSVFELLSADAPAARYIFPFGDRLLALQDNGDKQSLAWCADGNILDWIGVDTGQIFLVDGQIDPIDDLMAGAQLGAQVAALYRKRSIMRVFETGNVAQSIAAVKWIEGLGTEARFSVQIVPKGNIFLGHDRMVYYLTEGGETVPIGAPIREELVKSLTGNLELVDSVYDSVLQEYWLGIPELGAEHITAIWILDFGAILRENGIFWRRRPASIRRLAAVSTI